MLNDFCLSTNEHTKLCHFCNTALVGNEDIWGGTVGPPLPEWGTAVRLKDLFDNAHFSQVNFLVVSIK